MKRALAFFRFRQVDLTEGVIWRQMLRYALPLVLTNVLQQLYNTADLMIVGRYAGDAAMASIGATGSLSFMLIGFFMGLSTGASVVVAQAFGAKDPRRLDRAVHTTYATAIASGLVLTLLGHFFTPAILRAMKTPPDIFAEALRYARIFFYGSVPLLIYNMGSGILRSVGDSRRPFVFLVISSVMNIILDLVFVKGYGLGSAGAGYATLISQIASALLVTLTLMRTHEAHRLYLKRIRFHLAELRQTFTVGVPAGIQSALISFSNVLIQAQVNLYGTAAIAGVSAANRYDAFMGVGLQAFTLTATTFTGQNIGAKQGDRLKQGARTAMFLAMGWSFVIGALLFTFGRQLLGIFSPVTEVIDFGFRKMRILTPLHWLFAIPMTLSGIIRGAGKSFVPMLISLFSMCGLRMLWIYGVTPFWQSIDVVFLSYPISWIFTLILTVAYYRSRRWVPQELEHMMDA